MQVRTREGVEALDGIDTLAVHLLAELGRTTTLESLSSSSNAVDLQAVTPVLQRHQQWHALAILEAANDQATGALDIWKVRLNLPELISKESPGQ